MYNEDSKTKIFIKLFLFILIVKIIYIFSEYLYNLNILNISSSLDFFDEKKMEQINNNGHLISSFGITLLLTPIIYFIIKKIAKHEISQIFKNIKISVIYLIVPIFIFFITYISLNKLVDYVVEKNIDKSYQAYYLNIFKVGLMNNYYKYDSFLNYEKIKNDNLNTNDKIMFINTFLLLNADKELLEKLKNIGKSEFLNIYIDQNKEDFQKNFNNYLSFDKSIAQNYEEFKNEKIKINSKINNLKNSVNTDNANVEYKKLKNNLEQEYSSYLKKINKNKDLINNEKKLFSMIDDLNSYLENKSKYQSFYDKKIRAVFGKYIPVERFLDNGGNPNIMILKNVLEEELNSNVLSFNEFTKNKEVQNTIYKNLKNKNLNPTPNVDYTIENNFLTLFSNNKNKVLNNLENNIKNDLNKKLGNNDLTLDMDYEKYTNSKFIKEKIKDNLKSMNLDTNNIINVINVLNSKDKENAFKNEIYLNIIKQNKIVEKYSFNENDFQTNDEAKELGIKSIKLLYIPIFALTISLISLLLNSVTVFTLVIGKIFNLNKIVVIGTNLFLIIIIIVIPFLNNKVLDNNIVNMLNKNETLSKDFDIYFKILDFVVYYENFFN